MSAYTFKFDDVAEQRVSYGVDVRPEVLPKTDRAHFDEFSRWACQDYPELFERTVIGSKEFKLQRTFVLPGKKQLEADTLVLTPRGPVFKFPEKISALHAEIAIPDKEKIFRRCLKKFREVFPTRQVLRVGVVYDYIFATDKVNSAELLASDMGLLKSTQPQDVEIKVLFRQDVYNVTIRLSSATAHALDAARGVFQPEPAAYGINVVVDINNHDMSQDLNDTEIAGILAFAEDYRDHNLLPFLNKDNVA